MKQSESSDSLSKLVSILLTVLLLMWLWNWLFPSIFGLRTVNYWEALGLYVFYNSIRFSA